MHYFGWGNLKSLRDDPEALGINTREELLKFHTKASPQRLRAPHPFSTGAPHPLACSVLLCVSDDPCPHWIRDP